MAVKMFAFIEIKKKTRHACFAKICTRPLITSLFAYLDEVHLNRPLMYSSHQNSCYR